jgi:hypothetical protein
MMCAEILVALSNNEKAENSNKSSENTHQDNQHIVNKIKTENRLAVNKSQLSTSSPSPRFAKTHNGSSMASNIFNTSSVILPNNTTTNQSQLNPVIGIRPEGADDVSKKDNMVRRDTAISLLRHHVFRLGMCNNSHNSHEMSTLIEMNKILHEIKNATNQLESIIQLK